MAYGKGLVLGGGGVTGVAWETGLLFGLAERGADLSEAGLIVGTSAGAAVAAQVTGAPLEKLYEAQVAGATREIPAAMKVGDLLKFMVSALWPGDPRKGRAWLGRQALKAPTVSEQERRAVIEQRVGRDEWPATPLRIAAVEALTGKLTVFDASSGVSLIDAVAASCAVPLTWPPVTIDGVRYIDGGVRTAANVDLAKGCERAVVIAPLTQAVRAAERPAGQLAALGVPGVVITPSAQAKSRMGRNPLDPAFRAASAEAGRVQAEQEIDAVKAIWS